MGCCDPGRYGRLFNERFARRVARRYRKRGLDKHSRRIAEFLRARGLEGATVLEIGGGVGEIQVELLKAGAARSLNLELSPEYEPEARRLADENGVGDRVDRRLHDIAAEPDAVEPADVVVLHRVVCCYPDYERLLSAAADHAQRLLVFSHPPRNSLIRMIISCENLGFRVMGKAFRTFAHPPAAMVAVAEGRGMRTDYTYRGPVRQIVGLAREATAVR